MKLRVLLLLVILAGTYFSFVVPKVTMAAGNFPAPRHCMASGASLNMSIPKGAFVWGYKLTGYTETNVLVSFPNGGRVIVTYGCVESIPNTTLAGRKGYLDSTYNTQFTCYVGNVKNPSCNGIVPTATRTLSPTKTLVATKTPTKTATVSRTSTPSRTATRSLTPSLTRTVTPINSLRVDKRLDGVTKHLPQIGEIVWCRKFGSETNTIRKITINHFYYVPVTDCGLQNKLPFTDMGLIKAFLETTTKETWTVVK